MHSHTCSALNKRLHHEGSQLITMGGKERLSCLDTGGLFMARGVVRRRNAYGVKEHGSIDLVEKIDPTHADRANGVAVVGITQCRKAMSSLSLIHISEPTRPY